MSHGYPVSSWPFRLMEPRSRQFAAWETQSIFIPSRRRSFNMGRCSVVSVEWSSLFLTRVFLAMHRCCTRQIKETSATVVAPPNSAYFQEVIPLFQQHLAQL